MIDLAGRLFIGVLLALAGSAFIVWGYQILKFAETGTWKPLSAAYALYHLTGAEWFATPQRWIGIQMALEWLNAGAAAGLALFVFFFILVVATETSR